MCLDPQQEGPVLHRAQGEGQDEQGQHLLIGGCRGNYDHKVFEKAIVETEQAKVKAPPIALGSLTSAALSEGFFFSSISFCRLLLYCIVGSMYGGVIEINAPITCCKHSGGSTAGTIGPGGSSS